MDAQAVHYTVVYRWSFLDTLNVHSLSGGVLATQIVTIGRSFVANPSVRDET